MRTVRLDVVGIDEDGPTEEDRRWWARMSAEVDADDEIGLDDAAWDEAYADRCGQWFPNEFGGLTDEDCPAGRIG